MNRVTFHLAADKHGIMYISARVVTPLGKEFHVGYHPNIGTDGQRDGLNFGFNGTWDGPTFTEAAYDPKDNQSIWLEDKGADDMFCSEMFGELTGRYPYEIEESIEPNQDYAAYVTKNDD